MKTNKQQKEKSCCNQLDLTKIRINTFKKWINDTVSTLVEDWKTDFITDYMINYLSTEQTITFEKLDTTIGTLLNKKGKQFSLCLFQLLYQAQEDNGISKSLLKKDLEKIRKRYFQFNQVVENLKKHNCYQPLNNQKTRKRIHNQQDSNEKKKNRSNQIN
ncbi:hypothetical protein M0812_29481 [Anaeramoeba flamelloides]|uniref:PWI domain-containing protein n=1 Tax=Anaeramoeba flamelloides TaxID=1746091 RepID=A0AAV7Y6R2_9EUKA|nr:hypothetical protein M0812_29481 [Anaeramoeba flamelloides]